MRTLRVLKTSTLSVVSAITLSIRSDCLSLTDRAPESSLCLSQWTPVSRWLLSGLHANYCNQTQVFLILHLTHLLTAVSWVFLPLQTSLNHAPLATHFFIASKNTNSVFSANDEVARPRMLKNFFLSEKKLLNAILSVKAQKHEKCFFLMKWNVFCNAEDRFSWVWVFLQKKSF